MPFNATARAPQAKVLVVGEDLAEMRSLAQRLAVRKVSATVAQSGEEALRIITADAPDLVLLNVGKSDFAGVDALKQIRKNCNAAELPVIMMSAGEDRQTMLSIISSGANDVVTQPIDFELLVARIAVQLSVRAAFQRALTQQARLQRRLEVRARLEEQGYGDAGKRIFLMNELHRGLAHGDVRLHYQPQFRIRSGRIVGAEALMRWTSPSLGRVPTDQFLQVAEETGDIAALTHWTVLRAIEDQARFAQAGHDLRVAVNVPASLIDDCDFVDQLLNQLSDKADAISLELTESAMSDNPDRAIANLRRLADVGLRVAVDDYGTGMSSLSYLQKLPVREVKIDRTFISTLTDSHRDPLLVRSTIELAHAFEFEVVAEGVEKAETLALLSAMGCDVAQGFYIGAPMSPDALMSYLVDAPRLAALRSPVSAQTALRGAGLSM